MPRSRVAEGPPEGLVLREHFLSRDEERAVLDELERLEFHEIRMHDVVARRTARHFGMDYDYERRAHVEGAEPLPDWLAKLRDRCSDFAGVEPEELVEALVQRYPEGAPIGWHRDAPSFGIVVGVSLGAPSRMRFRRGKTGDWTTYDVELPARSAYVLAGAARWTWQHSIPPVKELRYSVTFRSLRRERGSSSPAT
jgi:alkylated DNA repair protein (DNA oxidative demethylase)